MNTRALIIASGIGTALQLVMVIAGHLVPYIADHVFMVGGMTISALAGVLYALSARSSYGDSATGGVIAGALCALVGIAVSVLLGDTATTILALGTTSSAVTGALGSVAACYLVRPPQGAPS